MLDAELIIVTTKDSSLGVMQNDFGKLLKKLCSKTEGAIDALKLTEDDAVDMDALMNMPYYQPYTKQKILMSYGSSPFLYEPILDFVPWAIRSCRAKKQSAENKK